MASWSIESIPAFCITLGRRPDRWRRFQDQSGINGLNLKRFLAVDGKTIDVKTDPRISLLAKRNITAKTRRSHEELDSVGGVGCALSHIAIWQWMVDNNQELCLVFEDDAVVPPDFIQRADACIKESTILKDPKKWDIWLIAGHWDSLTQIPGEKKAVRVGEFMTSHGYVMTLHAAKRLLKDAYPIEAHIDLWMSIYNYVHDMRLVGCLDLNLKQNGSTTDIQTAKGCDICNVQPGYSKTHTMVHTVELRATQIMAAASVGLLGWMLWRKLRAD